MATSRFPGSLIGVRIGRRLAGTRLHEVAAGFMMTVKLRL
jgi:hypothetical protein